MSTPAIRPYGAWPSPILAADVVEGGLRLSGAAMIGDEVWWVEGRPAEGGRQTIVRRRSDGSTVDVLPAPWNARSRVHEYGGSSWLAVPTDGGHLVVFANYADQRLYRVVDDAIEPLTPATHSSVRYAEPTLGPGGTEIWCVRESHVDGRVVRQLAAPAVDARHQVRGRFQLHVDAPAAQLLRIRADERRDVEG